MEEVVATVSEESEIALHARVAYAAIGRRAVLLYVDDDSACPQMEYMKPCLKLRKLLNKGHHRNFMIDRRGVLGAIDTYDPRREVVMLGVFDGAATAFEVCRFEDCQDTRLALHKSAQSSEATATPNNMTLSFYRLPGIRVASK